MIKFFLILLTLTFIGSCGKKGSLEYTGKREKPSFDGVSDEIDKKIEFTNQQKSES